MTGFEDRQKGFENLYKHDEELKFKISARRNKLLGEWVGRQLGLSGAALDDYAKSVVMADLEKPGDDDVIAKVLGDFKAKGMSIGEGLIRAEMEKLQGIAKAQLMKQK